MEMRALCSNVCLVEPGVLLVKIYLMNVILVWMSIIWMVNSVKSVYILVKLAWMRLFVSLVGSMWLIRTLLPVVHVNMEWAIVMMERLDVSLVIALVILVHLPLMMIVWAVLKTITLIISNVYLVMKGVIDVLNRLYARNVMMDGSWMERLVCLVLSLVSIVLILLGVLLVWIMLIGI